MDDDTPNKKKYNGYENVLLFVNKKIITLCDDEVKRNNVILRGIVEQVIAALKKNSELFRTIYNELFYGGSFYDGLKVGKPEEFDLDLLLCLPSSIQATLIPVPEVPGFVKCMVNDSKGISEIVDDTSSCLTTTKVLSWMEGLITKAMDEFEQSGTQHKILVNNETYLTHVSKSGPAFTLKINGNINSKPIQLDVDLVPCFVFDDSKWPSGNFEKNTTKEKKFFIVPKQPKIDSKNVKQYWRMSFQKQERLIMSGNKNVKPAVKLIKKLRDKFQQNMISSYFIKTMFLWEVKKRPKPFWECSLSFVFVEMLQVYYDHLQRGKIPYYWNKQNNLIANISPITLSNMANRIKGYIDTINKNVNNPICIAKEYLNDEDIEELRVEFQLPNKCKKNLKLNTSDDSSLQTLNGSSSNLEEIASAMKLMSKEISDLRSENGIMRVAIVSMEAKLKDIEDVNRLLLKYLQQKCS